MSDLRAGGRQFAPLKPRPADAAGSRRAFIFFANENGMEESRAG